MIYPLPEKLRGKKYYIPIKITPENNDETLRLKFHYAETLIPEIKVMTGARWDPKTVTWTIKNNSHNRFQLAYLAGWNPYAQFDRPYVDFEHKRFDSDGTPTLMSHQVDLVRHALTVHWGIWAAEMRTGKTLAAIEVIERSGFDDWYWIGPKSALAGVALEMRKWQIKVKPTFLTYDGLRNLIKNWPSGYPAPHGVVFDESSRLKNPTAQRTIAAQHLADAMREEHGQSAFIILMSGSPAPKSPADWYSQAEIACPGFIREGSYEKFKNRLGLIVNEENPLTGGSYPRLITWKDDERKCAICGELKAHENHISPSEDNKDFEATLGPDSEIHEWTESVNEVAYLYKRMKGLVNVKFMRDCWDLPPKLYRIIECKPDPATLRAAKLISAAAQTTIAALTLLRELSDGFQYQELESGQDQCPLCSGTGLITRPVPVEDGFEDSEISCTKCGGSGFVSRYKRHTAHVQCPKDEIVRDILDTHNEDGRLVIYGGFSGTIDHIISIVQSEGWNWARVDGRGWDSSMTGRLSAENILERFQDPNRQIEKMVFVGQPSAAGMGIDLSASCETVYYSNDFNAESRIQSEERIIGPAQKKGALITDIVHLPSDRLVLENLQAKRKLQDLSLGVFREVFQELDVSDERLF